MDIEPKEETTIILNQSSGPFLLRGWLVRLNSQDLPIQSYELNKPVISIGRNSSCDIVVDDKTVSRRHCTIEYRRDKSNPYIVEQDSVNGIVLENYPVTESVLDDGMRVRLGKVNFLIKLI